MMNANVTAETDVKSMDAVDGSAPAAVTTNESQLPDVEVASDALILEDNHMSDAANLVVLIPSQEVSDGLPDAFVASEPLGSMWIPDLRYHTVALVRRSCQMAGQPWPNYCV